MKNFLLLILCTLSACNQLPPETVKTYDVVVVGGGLSGLSAAYTLNKMGLDVVVLEANDRVGGRTWTEHPQAGGWVDMGGQWVGPGQDNVLNLCKELDIKVFPSYFEGKNILYYNGNRTEFEAQVQQANFPLSEAGMADFKQAEKKIDQMALTVPVKAPWQAAQAQEWDSQTVESWMQDNMTTKEARFVVKMFTLGYFASEPSDISLLHFLFYIQAAGGLKHLHSAAIAMRLEGGTQQLSMKMSEKLGDKVKLNSPVLHIKQSDSQVCVSTPDESFIAKQVIVAMAPPLAARIYYEPALPADRDQFTQRAPMGSTIKVHAVYSKPFWREMGFSGMVMSQEDPLSLVVDNTPESGSPGILGGFFEAQGARDWADKSDDEIQEVALAAFVKYFGEEARTPEQFFIANWGDLPWSRGCFTSVLPPGVWTGYKGAIRTPIGRIYWAGSETATEWYAYMDGAIGAGITAANEVEKVVD